MTGRTHDLAAFTLLNIAFVTQPVPHMTIATAIVAFGANMIGGLLPDIDDASADIWDKVRGGSLLAKIVKPIIGSHRMLSHSIIGMATIGFLLKQLLTLMGSVLLVDMNIIWWSVMIGYLSHLITDSMTTDGVPWLLPIRKRFGFPPLRQFRMKTGGIVEHWIFSPGLFVLNGYLIYTYYPQYLQFLRSIIAS